MVRERIKAIFVISMMLLSLLCIPIYATDLDTAIDEPIVNRYKYVSAVSTTLSISGSTANISVKVDDSAHNTTKIKTTAYLQKYSGGSWHNVTSWNKTVTTYTLKLIKTKNISSGKYRVKSVTKAYYGSNYETIKSFSKTVTK